MPCIRCKHFKHLTLCTDTKTDVASFATIQLPKLVGSLVTPPSLTNIHRQSQLHDEKGDEGTVHVDIPNEFHPWPTVFPQTGAPASPPALLGDRRHANAGAPKYTCGTHEYSRATKYARVPQIRCSERRPARSPLSRSPDPFRGRHCTITRTAEKK